MQSADIIVVGAGACGLTIARKLSGAGKTVMVLEARDRTGGRIHTIEDPDFEMQAEGGAEFIHGNLPVTFALLKEADIQYRISRGDTWQFYNGELTQEEEEEMPGENDLFTSRLQQLKEDITVADFLDTYFSSEKYAGLKENIKGFVEGYDAADFRRASAFALRKEWQEINDGPKLRVNGGYISLVRFLENECTKKGCTFFLNTIVKQITWQKGRVEVNTADHKRYTAGKVIVTVPLGVLCAGNQARATISFSPLIIEKEQSFRALGYGGVIKILLLFRHAFWKDLKPEEGKDMKDMCWLFSGETIPTWWTQVPDQQPLLTGWLAGPASLLYKDADDSAILQKAQESLCNIFRISNDEFRSHLVTSKVVNWVADPFSLGAYSYATPQSREAAREISKPLENTLFFAGEALYNGPESGTVEAALGNGQDVAKLVLGSFQQIL